MPNAVNARRGEQWELCDQCGRQFPMSKLIKQKGLLVCVQECFDNLEVERRPLMIERSLGSSTDQEGVDLRVIDRSFFEGSDEGVT